MNRDLLAFDPGLAVSVADVFGLPDDPMEVVEARASLVLPGRDAIVWEGDAATFQFTYVGEAAERVLGYPVERWREPGFWAEVVVLPFGALGGLGWKVVRPVASWVVDRALRTMRDRVEAVHPAANPSS